jgi:hypothetical protein
VKDKLKLYPPQGNLAFLSFLLRIMSFSLFLFRIDFWNNTESKNKNGQHFP